ncbi:glutamine amidotransferase [Knoellia sinensis KCTC 19936]|uniref:Glutamine amidotransferase n=1 Tax=Knoellia sinensis KCTC 19936 TaxID=1385520 RepID=A0A0A0J946_9MICO|nr:type 1 glutamine amidotransferase [Knoellia sinensis]KGN33683.1 glutamine amidotransferase [Knoellia sinensis KCTC 19936]
MPRYLVIQHEPAAPGGWLVERWSELGSAVETIRGDLGEPIPARLTHDALVVLGGAMNANEDDRYAWLAPTKSLLRAAVADGIPTLGVCLGHQLLAVALGGEVIRNPHGRTSGLIPLSLNAAGEADPLLSGLSGREVVQYNGDIVSRLPEGAESLATAPDSSVQAARFGPRAWGVQFHPETTPEIFKEWMANFSPEPHEAADSPARWLAEMESRRDVVRSTGYAVADAFARA